MKEIIHTDQAPAAVGPYSQAVTVNNLIFASGQIPLNPQSGTIDSEDIAEQTEQVMRNIAAVLEAGGSSMEQIIKAVVYVTDLNDFATVNEVYARHMKEPYPARVCVEVSALPKNAKVEIEVTATK